MSISSIYFGPAASSTTNITRKIIRAREQYGDAKCACPPASTNKRIYDTSYTDSFGNVSQQKIIVNPDNKQTRSQRISTLINNSMGGRTQFGNPGITHSSTFLGRTEGQPGGIMGPLRNRF
jgi:hypothetical protein